MARPTPEDFQRVATSLTEEARLNFNYLVLIVSSCLIATLGLLSNSAAVIIGAMIIAPLMLPLRAMAFGALEADVTLFRSSLLSLAWGTLTALALSWLTGRLVSFPEFGSEVLARTQPNLIDLGIAIAAGGISGVAKVRPQISDALPGTAIAVALMPPLCVVGLTLSQGQWANSGGAFLLYLTNLLGITTACMLVFAAAGYDPNLNLIGSMRGRITLALTGLLVVPLGLSFSQLLQQARLQRELQTILLQETITVGRQVSLSRLRVDWGATPPRIYLAVRASEIPTGRQVKLVEQFLQQRVGKTYEVIMEVLPVQEVRAETKGPTPPVEPSPVELEEVPPSQVDKEQKPPVAE
ncbi:MAG: DUF389 domain-containing protein [Gloeomargaritaceae cyanobacterium C42_A2020_066]|nr:DUF389 domain-containing protein [Gloeomargaritaceae cyanobacterium C42_A2020_066]